MKNIVKTIKIESVTLEGKQYQEIEDLFEQCGKIKNYFYQRFSGIRSLLLIQNAKELRNLLRKEDKERKEKKQPTLSEFYGIPQRYWIMILFDTCSNLKSCWSNLANRIKESIRENPNFTNDDKNYLYYILSAPKLWYEVLNRKELSHTKKSKELESLCNANISTLHNYLRRMTRKLKFKTPKIKVNDNELQCISLDQEMYKIIDGDKKNKKGQVISLFQFVSRKSKERFCIPLKSAYCYHKTGNIQLVFDRKKKCIRIHKLIKIKGKGFYNNKNNNNNESENKEKNITIKSTVKVETKAMGIDKGYHTILSCSNNKEYGKELGPIFTKESNRLNQRNTQRNFYIQSIEKTKTKVKEKQVKLGNKLYTKQHKKAKAFMEQQINLSIKEMVKDCVNNNITTIVIEKLDIRGNTKKGKSYNRKISNWLRGFLQERLEYICTLYGIKIAEVNPAYTSQYCHICGEKIERIGPHSEIAICPNCGKMDANINASYNILKYYEDPIYKELITIYTPYKKVKEILNFIKQKQEQ